MIQLLYLATSVVPLLVMFVVYRLADLLPPLFNEGVSCESLSSAWKVLSGSQEIVVLSVTSAVLLVVGWAFMGWKSRYEQQENFQFDSVSNLNSEALNFFLALALGLITADTLNYAWLWTLFAFLAILGWRLNDYKVNLLLWFLGIRQYALCHANGVEHTLITRHPLKNQQGSVKVVRLADRLLLEVK